VLIFHSAKRFDEYFRQALDFSSFPQITCRLSLALFDLHQQEVIF
jgi:hypothetical protein